MVSRQPRRSPGHLEVVTPGNGINVENFPGEVKSRYQTAFHSLEINLFQGHAAAGHKLFFEDTLSGNLIAPLGQFFGEALELLAGDLGPDFFRRDSR